MNCLSMCGYIVNGTLHQIKLSFTDWILQNSNHNHTRPKMDATSNYELKEIFEASTQAKRHNRLFADVELLQIRF